jgi:hypothetical protein
MYPIEQIRKNIDIIKSLDAELMAEMRRDRVTCACGSKDKIMYLAEDWMCEKCYFSEEDSHIVRK